MSVYFWYIRLHTPCGSHARLQAVTLGGDPENPIKIDNMSELETVRRLAFLLTKGRQMLLDELVARLDSAPREKPDRGHRPRHQKHGHDGLGSESRPSDTSLSLRSR